MTSRHAPSPSSPNAAPGSTIEPSVPSSLHGRDGQRLNQIACERSGACSTPTSRGSSPMQKCPEGARRAPNPLAIPTTKKYVVPDAIFGLQKDRPSFFAVEIDRRTELINSDTAKTAFGRKLYGYLHILTGRTARISVSRTSASSRLTVTTNALHLQSMLNFYHSLKRAGRCISCSERAGFVRIGACRRSCSTYSTSCGSLRTEAKYNLPIPRGIHR